jgi:hypothetical protein
MGEREKAWAPFGALACALLLGACGGGGSGTAMVSTPPPVTYTKLADLTGNQTFQTAGVQYNTSQTPGFANATTQAFGSGVTVSYTETTDSYRLTAPDGSTVTFDPSNAAPPLPTAPNSQVWIKTSGTQRDQLAIFAPVLNGVPLSYTLLGSWIRMDTATGQSTVRLAVGGVPTVASDVPRTGSATYSTLVGGAAVQNGTSYSLNANSTATFSANFAANSVTTALTLIGAATPAGDQPTNLGTFNGTGTISATGPGITGTLTGANGVTGAFSGAFFGPRALEVGYDWHMSGGSFSAIGTMTGIKQ